MGKLVENLKKHFKETPKDVLDKEFQEIYDKYGHIGPTVDEYIKSVYETTNDPEMKKIIEKHMKNINSYINESLRVQKMNLLGRNFKVTLGDLKDVCQAVINDKSAIMHGYGYYFHWEIPGTWKKSQYQIHYKRRQTLGLRFEYDDTKQMPMSMEEFFKPENITSVKMIITDGDDGWRMFGNDEMIDTKYIPINIDI